VTLTTPPEGATYSEGQVVDASFSCTAGEDATIEYCAGLNENGTPINTSSTGPKEFAALVKDTDGRLAAVDHHYTVIERKCTTAVGHGTYGRRGQNGRLKLANELSTNLAAPQTLHVKYDTGAVHFRLLTLTAASCTGAAGERVFEGRGTAAVSKASGYSLTFTLKEVAAKFFFEATLTKGSETIHEVSGGPLKTSTEKIS
jgi:hypothetical protein